MKIVFSVGTCEKTLHVTTKLLYAVCKKLAQKGHHCYLVGCSKESSGRDILFDGVEMIRFMNMKWIRDAYQYYEVFCNNRADANKAKIEFLCRHPVKAVLVRLHYLNPYMHGYGRQVSKIVQQVQADAVICLQDPIWAVKDALKHLAKYEGKKAIYQVDPWGLFDQDKVIGAPRRISDEIHAVRQVDWVFTTPVLYKQYATHGEYGQYIGRMVPVDFPNMEKKQVKNQGFFGFDTDRIHILFCGSIQGEYRNPTRFLNLLAELMEKNKKIVCHFMGEVCAEYIDPFMERYPNRFKIYGFMPPEEAYNAMLQADFLLNIGNTFSNMVPSKIFDYFSVGKPIINIQKLKDCPARAYFDRYPSCLTLEEWHMEEYRDQLMDFLNSKTDEMLAYEEIEKIYVESTPAYVADALISALQQKN